MALQNFVDKVGPVVSAAWLNAVDLLKFTIFADSTTKAQARTALTSDAPLEIANGGTGSRLGATPYIGQTSAPTMQSPGSESGLGVTPVTTRYNEGMLDRYTATIGAGISDLAATYLPLLQTKPYIDVMDFIPATEHAAILNFTSTTDLYEYLQTAVNFAALYKKQLIQFPPGRFQYSSALWLNRDGTENPDFPTETFEQGRLVLRGAGTMDVAAWTNAASGGYVGTVLRCTGTETAMIAENQAGSLPVRNIELEEMTIAANSSAATDHVLSLKGANTRISLRKLFLVQENVAGSGLEMEDCFLSDMDDVWCYQDDELGLGIGALIRNVSTSAGDYTGKNLTVRGWKGATLAASTAITGVSLANECQVTSVAHGLVSGDVVFIDGITGTTQLNGKYFSVLKDTDDIVTLRGINSTAMSVYSADGTIQKATAYGKGAVFGHETFGSGTNINTLSFDVIQTKDNIIGMEIGHGISMMKAYVHNEGSLLAGIWLRNNPDSVKVDGYFANPLAGMGDIILGDSTLTTAAREWGNVQLGPLKHANVGYGCAVKVDFVNADTGALSISNMQAAPANTGFSKFLTFPTGLTSHNGVDLRALRPSVNFGTGVENYAQVEYYQNSGLNYFGQLVEIDHRLKLTKSITPSTIAGDQNDYNPSGLATTVVVRLSASGATRTITGLVATGDGDVKVLHNAGAEDIILASENAGSAAANRFAFVISETLTTNSSAILRYDATSSRWRCMGIYQ